MRRILAGSLLSAVLLSGCGGVIGSKKPAPAAGIDANVVQANARFGFDLFRLLREDRPNENLFISPASISLALAMTYNGARGETQQAMAKALAIDSLSPEGVNTGNAALQSVLANPDPKVQLDIANSIWHMKGHKVNPAFAEIVKNQYRAQIGAVEFGKPSAVKTINKWIADATRDKIPSMLDTTSPQDRMYLVNAIYFNGTWKEPFNPEQTRPQTFTRADGSTKEHPMMSQGGSFRHLQGDTFQAVALPYGEGRVNLYVFLPNEGISLTQFSQELTAERWEQWMGAFKPRTGSIALPKVRLTYDKELSPMLKQMGMSIAFDAMKADFSGLFDEAKEPLYISFVLHKSFLDMNERGTEAAAATVVGVRAGSAQPTDPFQMIVNRPYLIAIRDDQTGALLFLGAIMDPKL